MKYDFAGIFFLPTHYPKSKFVFSVKTFIKLLLRLIQQIQVKMEHLADNVREEVAKFVPTSILDDIACFVFYDDHPVQRKFCDITICTKHGEVKEYYKREEVSSLLLRSNFKACQIKILRNNKCHLYYLVISDHEVVILARGLVLKVHQRVSNMEFFDVDDYGYSGQAALKVVQRDDAVPLIFDDNFQRLSAQAVFMNGVNVDDSMPVLVDLKRKLSQAQYSIASNMKTKTKLNDLRKLVTFAAYQKMHPSLEDSMFQQNYKQKFEALKLQSKFPLVTICNQKIVIILHVINKNKQDLKDVMVLLHAKNKAMVYTTRLYRRKSTSPFWEETTQTLPPEVDTAIAVVVNLTEVQYSLPRKIEFNGVISYKRLDKECLLPFEYIVIPYAEAMGKRIDVLANDIDEYGILAAMASTEKVELCLRIIGRQANEPQLPPLPHLFGTYLEMEEVKNTTNIVIHKKSAHHVLNGVMVIFKKDGNARHMHHLAVHVRSPGQVLSLINYISDTLPIRVVVTGKNHKITATIDLLRIYKEEIPRDLHLKINYVNYAVSILNQGTAILDYLDGCMIKMNHSKNTVIQSKIGNQIDLFADGKAFFIKFRTFLLEEALTGIRALKLTQLNSMDSFLVRENEK